MRKTVLPNGGMSLEVKRKYSPDIEALLLWRGYAMLGHHVHTLHTLQSMEAKSADMQLSV